MICGITGDLKRVDEDRVQLRAGPVVFELLIPAADRMELQSSVGREVQFHTLCYLEGDPSRGNLEPRLIGFLRTADKRFFERFTTVKGIGVRTALKALTIPVGQIAQAIEEKNTRFLTQLKGVGKRTAELIVAELAGKVKDFAVGVGPSTGGPAAARPAFEEDAIAGLVALGEPRAVAERLLERAKQQQPKLKTAGDMIREMLILRGT
jgi:holliday junction DNA helicase RuvA